MAYQNVYDIEAWNPARAFKPRLLGLMIGSPVTERYDLSSQLSRSARFVLANIVQGRGRQTVKDELHFAIRAHGSLSEVLNHLIDARDTGYINDTRRVERKTDRDHVRRVLNGCVTYPRNRAGAKKTASQVSESKVVDLTQMSGARIDETDPEFISKINSEAPPTPHQ